jgi:hypothetical protein
MMNNPNNPLARQKGLVVQEMPDEVLVYDLDTNKAHCLNQSAALVWKSCDGNNSISDIMKHFELTGAGKVSEDFVWLAIDQLNENGLMDGDVAPRFAGQSRRQVLKTIGFASVVALPIIASVVAPQNALGAVNCGCTSNANCAGKTQCPAQTCNQAGVCST